MVNEFSIPERVAVLETENDQLKSDIREIKDKLDALLELKAKGMGALGLVGLIIGSGFIGVVFMVYNMFTNRSHL